MEGTSTRRSRVSCYPCRSRKSKCDQSRPCSSCVLRDTAHQCTDSAPESGSNKPVKAKRKRVEQPSPSVSSVTSLSAHLAKTRQPSPVQSVEQEVANLRTGLSRLENLLATQATAQILSQQDDEDDFDNHVYGPKTPATPERWSHIRSLLPPMVDTNLMFHYAFVESDWLLDFFDYRRFIRRWDFAFADQAIPDVLAVQVLALAGCAALFLADNSNRVLQSAIPIRSLHHKLVKEAVRILEATPHTAPTEGTRMDLIECHLFISLYFRCLSPDAKMARFVERALSLIIEFGLDDELHPSWVALTPFQIERRRVLVCAACVSARWLGFHARFVPVLDTIRAFRVGQPSYRYFGEVLPLNDWPCSLGMADANTSSSTVWKTKTPKQLNRVKQYLKVASCQSNLLPIISHLIMQIENKLVNEANTGLTTKQEYKQLAKQTRECLDTLSRWRTKVLPDADFGEDQIRQAYQTLSFRQDAKRVALMLMLNHAVYYMTAALLRPWVLLADRANRLRDHLANQDYEPTQMNDGFFTMLNQRTTEHVQLSQSEWLSASFWREMESRSIEIAQQSISTIPLIRAMQADPKSQFYVGWVAASLYEAALTLAVPLLGYHRRQASQQSAGPEPAWLSTTSPTDLGQSIVAVLEALAQLSNNAMAKGTGELLQKVMRAAKVTDRTGVQLPKPSTSIDNSNADDWEFSAHLPRLKQSATDGLALLAAASDDSAPADPYGWTSGSNTDSSKHTAASSVEANPVDSYEALLTSQAEAQVADAHFLDNLLKLDDSFWQSVMNSRGGSTTK